MRLVARAVKVSKEKRHWFTKTDDRMNVNTTTGADACSMTHGRLDDMNWMLGLFCLLFSLALLVLVLFALGHMLL